METLHYHRKLDNSLCILVCFLQLSSLESNSPAYSVPHEYFINCGSDITVKDHGRDFIGESSFPFTFLKHSSTNRETNQSSMTPPLYQTARVSHHHRFSYNFNIQNDGYHLLRLHFFAFSSQGNHLSSAKFHVSVPRFWLLQNFSALSNSPSVMEFFIPINRTSSFQIWFTPLKSSFAFVNAIELFLLPDNFIQYNESMASGVLHKSYRLSVGGVGVTIDHDTLWRNWDSDDGYVNTNGTKISVSDKLDYKAEDPRFLGEAGVATIHTAPSAVYQNARGINSSLSNITWSLHVKKSAKYFVRFHFCNIFNSGLDRYQFKLYINNELFMTNSNYFNENDVPFYLDYAVNTSDSGFMTISIGPDEKYPTKYAFLNGLEVMEIIDPMDERTGNNHFSVRLASALGALALLVFFLLVGIFLCLKFKKFKHSRASFDWLPLPPKGGGSSHGRWGSSHGSRVPHLNLELKIPFLEIQNATNNFDKKRIIGKGGFGFVYLGVLKNGLRVAVKRSEPGFAQGLPEFQTEIMVLSKIRHRHLVSLIGYCDENSEMILVYEYMEKGTLKDHLYKSNLPNLNWTQRLEICIGAARGLNYLHRGASGGIIHRDVKSTNILLDENHVAKVADFGLSRTGPLDQEPHVITGVKGTFGYLDPEYFRSYQLTEKSDVYSFGVLLLELLCARPAIDSNPMLPAEQVNLAEWGILCMNKGVLEEIIDPSIKGQVDPNSLRKFGLTVEKCLQNDGFDRPNMSEVLWDLEYALQLQRGARGREWHQDSSSGGASGSSLELPIIRRLPSLSTLGESEEMPIWRDDQDDSGTAVDSVFSQVKIDDGR